MTFCKSAIVALSFLLILACGQTFGEDAVSTLTVGYGKQFEKIGDAVAMAKAGDVILVYPQKGLKPYEKSAIIVKVPNITIRAETENLVQYIAIEGEGFEYSGIGNVPRAIFQFNKGADGCVLEGFDLSLASNKSFNGAGVRVNQANRVTIRNCSIHDNDMGIMSNGKVSEKTCEGLRIEKCSIHNNGNVGDPGFNHNLYLGGTSATLIGCEIFDSVAGNNLKSRCRQLVVKYCYIHDSANREIDIVDAKGNTDVQKSDALLFGNIISKKLKMLGNKGVIHFGEDIDQGRNGRIYLIHNTIATPHLSPVLSLFV